MAYKRGAPPPCSYRLRTEAELGIEVRPALGYGSWLFGVGQAYELRGGSEYVTPGVFCSLDGGARWSRLCPR